MERLTNRIRGGDGNIITDSETKCNVSTGPDPRYRLGMFGTNLDSTPEYGILSTTTSVPRSTIRLWLSRIKGSATPPGSNHTTAASIDVSYPEGSGSGNSKPKCPRNVLPCHRGKETTLERTITRDTIGTPSRAKLNYASVAHRPFIPHSRQEWLDARQEVGAPAAPHMQSVKSQKSGIN